MQSEEWDLAIIDGIRKAAAAANYDENVANVLCRAYRYYCARRDMGNPFGNDMKITMALCVVLSEMGYYVLPCLGFVEMEGELCAHAWLMTMEDRAAIDIANGFIHGIPVVFGLDAMTQNPTCYQYGVSTPNGFEDPNEKPFTQYLDEWGVWDVVLALWDDERLGKLNVADKELLWQRNADTRWYVF